MSKNERKPLLYGQSTIPSLYPPYLGEKQPRSPPPPAYGVTEVTLVDLTANTKPRQPGGIASTPIVALIALGVGLVLIFGVTLITPDEKQLVHTVLKQSNSDNNNNDNAGYKDITIPQGRLRGFTKKSRQGRDYTAYYKVPYSEPPLGEYRMKDPIAPRSLWQGLRAIPVVAPQCIQKEKYSDVVQAVGEEDCLYSNIYVPNNAEQNEAKSYPVMVYIHGGGFTDGNGSRYGADYFMDEDVILITFQFRLGPFGFLNTNDDVIHGNMGLKDQVQMLKWTRDNIEYFNGDPNRVTIFGNSGGGISVSFLMLSPMATGLFHRAISQSGASACAASGMGMLNVDTMSTIKEVGRVLNCDSTDSVAFLECLRTKDASEIALVRNPLTTYSISVENHNDEQVFMPDTPYNVLRDNPNKVPYIIGIVNAEWTGQGLNMVRNEELANNLNEDFAKYGAEVANVVDMSNEELLSIKEFYFGDKKIANDTFREAINLASDRGLIHCTYVSAHMHSKYSPAYLYYLSKPPYLSYAEKANPGFPAKELGLVSHADELQYLFLYDGYPEITVDDKEYFEYSRYLVKQWATFAATGAPTSDWQPVSSSSSNSTFWFELNDVSGRTEVLRDRMNFWDQFTHKQLKYDV